MLPKRRARPADYLPKSKANSEDITDDYKKNLRRHSGLLPNFFPDGESPEFQNHGLGIGCAGRSLFFHFQYILEPAEDCPNQVT